MKNRFALLLLLILLVPTWQGCDQSESSFAEQETAENTTANQILISSPAAEALPEAPLPAPTPPNQKIIYHASLEFEVGDYEKSSRNIESFIQAKGGYLEKGTEDRQRNTLANTLTIRVPAQNLDALLKALLRESVYLVEKNMSARDVSVEVVDVSARLTSKKAVESRYRDLLKNAKTIKEILEVEERLNFLREDIEATEARLRNLQSQIAYSTVTLRYYQQVPPDSSPSDSYATRLATGFSSGWAMLGSLVVGLVYMWPILLLLLIATMGYRYRQSISKGASAKG